MSVEINLNIFPCNKLIETIEFLKARNITYRLVNESNLVRERRTEEIQYLINTGVIIVEDFVEYYDLESHIDDVKYLAHIKMETTDNPGEYFMSFLYNHEKIEIVKYLIEVYGTDLSEELNYNNGKPLCLAAALGYLNIVALLIESGAQIEKCEKDPLVYALENNHIMVAIYLLNNGSKLKNISQHNINKIFENNCINSINFIIEQFEKSKMNHIKNMNWSPCLQAVVKHDNINVLLNLLRIGVDIANDYQQLKSICRHNNHVLMIQYLKIILRIKE